MPFTAIVDDTFVDLTDIDADSWARLRAKTGRPRVECRACGAPMHTRVPPGGVRHFVHTRRSPDCPTNGETPLHRLLKSFVADLARSVPGWSAALEASPGPGDSGGWRADVLAAGPAGRRVAFEIQHSGLTVADGQARTGRYTADGVEAVWIATGPRPWLLDLPGACVDVEHDTPLVVAGCARLTDGPDPWWKSAGPFSLDRFVKSLLIGKLASIELDRRWHTTVRRPDGRPVYITAERPHLFVLGPDVGRWAATAERRARRDAARATSADRALTARVPARERRARLLSAAVVDLAARHPGAWIRIVNPAPTRGLSYLDVTPPRPVPAGAHSDPFWANGTPLWVGEDRWPAAIVLPSARAAAAATMRARIGGLVIYADTEAARLALDRRGLDAVVPVAGSADAAG